MKEEDIKTLNETVKALARLRNAMDDLDGFINNPVVVKILGEENRQKTINNIYNWAWEAESEIDSFLAVEEMKEILWDKGLSVSNKLKAVEKLKELIIEEN